MTKSRPGRLPNSHVAAYALPEVPIACIVFPSYAILPGFYAQHTQISVVTIGAILIVARIVDAVTDPMVGFLSDITTSKWGSRKPWLIAGTLVLMVSVVALYAPAPTVGPGYYLGWFVAFYLGYTLIVIPHKAWGTDLAREYVDRSRIATSLAVAFSIGNLAFAAAPFLTATGSRTYDAETLSLVAWGIALALPVTVLIAVSHVPKGYPVPRPKVSFWDMLRSAARNGPLLSFLSIYVLTGFGQGIFYGLVFLYVSTVTQLGTEFAWFLLADAVVTLVSVPLWYWIIRAIQKHRSWALGLVISAVALAGMWWVPSGEEAFIPLLALICLRALGSGVIYVAPTALLGDVVDYELFKRKVNRAANFHALIALATKLTATVGGGAGLLVIGLAGYDAKIANPPEVITAFKLVTLAIPAVILIGAAMAALRFPLDRARHEIVRLRIEKRLRHE